MDVDVQEIFDSLAQFDLTYSDELQLSERLQELGRKYKQNSEELGDSIIAFLTASSSKCSQLNLNVLELIDVDLGKRQKAKGKENSHSSHIKSIKTSGGSNELSLSNFSSNNGMSEQGPRKTVHISQSNEYLVEKRGKFSNDQSFMYKPDISMEMKADDLKHYSTYKAVEAIEAKNARLAQFGHLFASHNLEILEWSRNPPISSDEVYVYGEILRDQDTIFIDGLVHIQQDDSNGSILRVNIHQLTKISLFPGQIVAFAGTMQSDLVFIATKHFSLPSLQKRIIIASEKKNIKICAAAGPFTYPNINSYQPLYDLVDRVKEEKANILILMGPFVDKKMLSNPNINITGSKIMNNVMEILSESLGDYICDLIIQPSVSRDYLTFGVFPAPPFVLSKEILRRFKSRVHLVSEPAILNIQDLTIAISNSEILAHLSRFVYESSDQEGDRMTRLASKLLEQRSIYPLAPSVLPSDITNAVEYNKLKYAPQIMILPSVLKSSILNIEGTIICNPGRMMQGRGGYLTASISLENENLLNQSFEEVGHYKIEKIRTM